MTTCRNCFKPHGACCCHDLSGFAPMPQEPGFEVRFRHAPGDSVRIHAIGMTGLVTGCMVDGLGRSYQVAYWNNGERKLEWILEQEIERG